MSIKLMSAIFETEFRDLPYNKDGEERNTKASTAKLLLLAIADHANDYGESAYPGYDKLEIKTALSRQGISDTLEALKQNGLIIISDEPSRLGTNDYTINVHAFPKMDESSHLTQTSQATLLGRVKPLDQNHPLTTIEPPLDIRFAKIQTALEKIGILLTSKDPMTIDIWMEKHDDEHIQKAIDITQAKGVRNTAYINTILAGWLENGYPETKERKTKKTAPIPQLTPEEVTQLQNSVDWSTH